MIKGRAMAVLTAGAIAGMLAALTPAMSADGAAATAGKPPRRVTLCDRGEHLAVATQFGDYVLKNNDFHPSTAPTCVTHDGTGPNFVVSKSDANSRSDESDAYPNLYSGCSWAVCSKDSALPARVSALRNPWASWYTTLGAGGRWDANLDIWLSRTAQERGQVTGAELMIWMSTRRFGTTSATTRIDGIRWHLAYWRTRSLSQPGVTWPLIIFRAVRPRTSLHRLALLPFFRRLQRLHLIHRGYWVDSIHAGFEIWRGGTGLRTRWFRDHLVR